MNSHVIRRDDNVEDMDAEEVRTTETDEIIVDANTTLTDISQINSEAMEVAENIESPDFEFDDDARPEITFTFTVKEFSKIKESIYSPPYMVRNLPWRIMILQRGDRNNRYLGYFLQCNRESENTTWNVFATAWLTICSQKEGIPDNSRKIQHLFYSKENDWGFSQFISYGEILDEERGYIKDDTVIFKARVVADAPHGVCWDSKKYTGYVGLKNQGATCYMNSLLQTLYFTNLLRKAVYKMPTESDDSNKSVALALQRVFYDLQYSEKPVGTKKLTKSFGWETLDSFMQHDVQEFLRVLLDKLESKMKGTCVEGTVPKLFEGKMESYIKCKNVNYGSRRTETFYDIQLNIKEKKNIDESFRDYIATEVLEGDNKYDAGEYGLQDAEKGVIFLSFPPVLHLHLMRFHYDPVTDCCVKYNDRFEFTPKINLDPYLLKPGTTPATYTLHAVLVHSGDNHGGHYVVFINPRGDGKWCKFDDDVVSRVSTTEAIDNNFGGIDEEFAVNPKHASNAYMLVYIRDSEMPTILQEVTDADIPSELEERVQEEKKLEIIKRKEHNEMHLYLTVNIYCEDCIETNTGPDLFDMESSLCRSVKMKKSSTIEEFLLWIKDTYGYSLDQMRVWLLNSRQHHTYRPAYLDLNKLLGRTIHEVAENQTTFNIYLELMPLDCDQNMLPNFDSNDQVLLFFKMYDPMARKIYYCGHEYITSTSILSDLFPMMNTMAGYKQNTELRVYEEIKANTIEPVSSYDVILEQALDEFTDGDVLIFQRYDPPYCDMPDVLQYFRDMLSNVDLIFYERGGTGEPTLALEVDINMHFKDLAGIVSQKLDIDKTRIQFYRPDNVREGVAGPPIPYNYDAVIKDMYGIPGYKRATRRMYYQILDMSLRELESRVPLKLLFVPMDLKEEKEITLYPTRGSRVSDMLEEAKKVVPLTPGGTGKLRILEFTSCRVLSGPNPHVTVESLMTSKSFRIEEIPKDELELGSDEILVPVAHFQREPYQTFGIPFLLKLKCGEPIALVKERLAKKLGISEKELDKYKIAVIKSNGIKYLTEDWDSPVHISIFQDLRSGNVNNPNPANLCAPWIGLDHPNKASKRSRFSCLEKSIKIYN